MSNAKVIQLSKKCFRMPGTNVSSVSWVGFIRSINRPNHLFHAELQFAPACLRAGVPYGVHIHGVTDAQLLFPRSRIGALLKSSFRDSLSKARYVLSHEMLVAAVKQLRSDVIKFESPVDLEQFSPRGKVTRLSAGLSFLSPSRIDQWKGHDVVWKALSQMKRRQGVRTHQVDWGWEPHYSRLKAAAPKSVVFIPVIPRGIIADYYRGADVVVGQMQLGYLGMAELEASACGAPVVVYSKDPSSPFLPKTPDPIELAALLDRLVADEGFRRRYASDCREYVLAHHDARALAARFGAIVDGPERLSGEGASARDIVQMELGTGLELAERALGRSSGVLRRVLLGL